MFHPQRLAILLAGLCLSVVAIAAEPADPPSRVARLSHVRGEVSFSPAGENDWVSATLNRPLIRGDRLWTNRNARAELQFGSAAVRLDEGTSFEILNLDDGIAQLEITQGMLNLRVRRLYQDQSYEIDTPTLAFSVTRPGEYRIDVDPRGRHTTVAVWDGSGEVYGENASFPIREGEAVRFFDPRLHDYEVYDIPRPDDFDRFCQERDQRMDRAASLRYVPDDLVGYSDLDDYGSWTEVHEYGTVWFPSRIATDWAPYRYGHWIWQEPWGWTWVDDAPWGFAPFHYGRWVYVGDRWGWLPGPIGVRPVYAPALVAFYGGHNWGVGIGGAPVGWFPLGPREVYVPPYRASRRYFTSVNVTNAVVNQVYITNVYNDYSTNRGVVSARYTYRDHPRAITAVPGSVFVNARPVHQAVLKLDRDATARADIARAAAVVPVNRSVIGAGPAATSTPTRDVLDRAVIARQTPPPAVLPFAARQPALQREPGRPLDADAAASLQATSRMRDVTPNVRVVGTTSGMDQRVGGAERTERGLSHDPSSEVRDDNPRGRSIAGDSAHGGRDRSGNADAAVRERRTRDEAMPDPGDTAATARHTGPADEAQPGVLTRPETRSNALPSRDYRRNTLQGKTGNDTPSGDEPPALRRNTPILRAERPEPGDTAGDAASGQGHDEPTASARSGSSDSNRRHTRSGGDTPAQREERAGRSDMAGDAASGHGHDEPATSARSENLGGMTSGRNRSDPSDSSHGESSDSNRRHVRGSDDALSSGQDTSVQREERAGHSERSTGDLFGSSRNRSGAERSSEAANEVRSSRSRHGSEPSAQRSEPVIRSVPAEHKSQDTPPSRTSTPKSREDRASRDGGDHDTAGRRKKKSDGDDNG